MEITYVETKIIFICFSRVFKFGGRDIRSRENCSNRCEEGDTHMYCSILSIISVFDLPLRHMVKIAFFPSYCFYSSNYGTPIRRVRLTTFGREL